MKPARWRRLRRLAVTPKTGILDGTNEAGTDWDHCLGNVRITPEGYRHWPELFVAEIPGWRPLVAHLTVPAGAGPHPVVVQIHGGGWMSGHPNVMSDLRRNLRVPETLLDLTFPRVQGRFDLESSCWM